MNPTAGDDEEAIPPHLEAQEQLKAELRATPVVMFSASWCAVCSRARDFFRVNGIPIRERDVDRDRQARDELLRRMEKISVPTLLIDGEMLEPGFSERSTLRALVASVERRLGLRGLGIELAPKQ